MKIDRRAVGFILIVTMLLGACSTASKPAETSPPSPAVLLEPEAPSLPQTDVESLQQSLEEQYYERVGEAIIQETRDVALKLELMTTLQEIRMARKDLKEVESKEQQGEVLSLQESRDKEVWTRKYNSFSREMRDLIEASADMYWVDFRIFNRKDITRQGFLQLAEIRHELSDACRLGREIIVAGFGCSIGGEEGTRTVSSIRAHRVANWINEHTTCDESQIAHVGMGMIVEEAHRSAAESPKGKEILAENRHALVLAMRKESVQGKHP